MANEARIRPARGAGAWSIFTTMALVVAVIVAAGFGPTYRRALAPPGLPLWVHLHGAVMTAWIALFVAQTLLIRRRALALHRALGLASLGLVVALVPLSVATSLLAVRRGAVPPFFTAEQMVAADLVDLALAVGFYGWALAWRRRAGWHKRLMLGAAILLAWPAIGRMPPLWQFGLAAVGPLSVAVLCGLAAIGPLHDRLRGRRNHPAYAWTLLAVIALYPLYMGLGASAPMHRLIVGMAPAPA